MEWRRRISVLRGCERRLLQHVIGPASWEDVRGWALCWLLCVSEGFGIPRGRRHRCWHGVSRGYVGFEVDPRMWSQVRWWHPLPGPPLPTHASCPLPGDSCVAWGTACACSRARTAP
jgi:hypothetical protein